MKRVHIFGNSGSGKSTLAKKVSVEHKLGHLDSDTLACHSLGYFPLPPEDNR